MGSHAIAPGASGVRLFTVEGGRIIDHLADGSPVRKAPAVARPAARTSPRGAAGASGAPAGQLPPRWSKDHPGDFGYKVAKRIPPLVHDRAIRALTVLSEGLGIYPVPRITWVEQTESTDGVIRRTPQPVNGWAVGTATRGRWATGPDIFLVLGAADPHTLAHEAWHLHQRLIGVAPGAAAERSASDFAERVLGPRPSGPSVWFPAHRRPGGTGR